MDGENKNMEKLKSELTELIEAANGVQKYLNSEMGHPAVSRVILGLSVIDHKLELIQTLFQLARLSGEVVISDADLPDAATDPGNNGS